MKFGGMRVIESAYLEQDGEPVTETRRYTWLQRLLTGNAAPWVATYRYTYRPKVPYRGAVQINATTWAMHPETIRQWQAEGR